MSLKKRIAMLEKAQPAKKCRPMSMREFYGEAAPLEEDWPYPLGQIITLADFYVYEAQLEANIAARLAG